MISPLSQVESSHSQEEEGGHAHHITVAWVDGKTNKDIVVDLNLNRDLIPESYAERYHHQVKHLIDVDSIASLAVSKQTILV